MRPPPRFTSRDDMESCHFGTDLNYNISVGRKGGAIKAIGIRCCGFGFGIKEHDVGDRLEIFDGRKGEKKGGSFRYVPPSLAKN